jgi:hypothetical protein
MANTSSGREHPYTFVHYLRKGVTFADEGTAVIIGTLPPGAVVLRAGLVIFTVFAGTTPTFDMGTTDVGDDFVDGASLETAGVIRDTTSMAGATVAYNAAAVNATITLIDAATSGAGVAWVEYLPNNDL